jgi:hypothetical protein
VDGEIKQGDAQALLQELELVGEDMPTTGGDFVLVLALNSGGGDVLEALKMTEVPRKLMITQSVVKGTCASACFLLAATTDFIFGTTGTGVHPTLGVHRPYLLPEYLLGMTAPQAEAAQRQIQATVEKTLREMNVANDVIEKMMATPSDQLHIFEYAPSIYSWPTFIDHSPYPGFEEWVKAQCDYRTMEDALHLHDLCVSGSGGIRPDICERAESKAQSYFACSRKSIGKFQLSAIREIVAEHSQN